MAQDVQIANVQYSDVPALEVPKVGGGTARFTDLSGDTLDANKVLAPYTGHDATGAPFVGAIVNGDELEYGLTDGTLPIIGVAKIGSAVI